MNFCFTEHQECLREDRTEDTRNSSRISQLLCWNQNNLVVLYEVLKRRLSDLVNFVELVFFEDKEEDLASITTVDT